MTETQAFTFFGLGIDPKILKLLESLHFTIPTPIQHQSIPPGLAGKDIIGIAQTGTGKTLAFGIPMIQRLLELPGRGLIVLPTRELAIQVNEALEKIARPMKMGSAVLIGGESMHRQIGELRRHPRILIATPGRLLDHMQQRFVSLKDIQILVLDEADRMLDMGFAPQINEILRQAPRQRQTLLYSATMPSAIMNIATSHMQLPVRVEVAPSGTAAEKVEQEIIIIHKEGKLPLLKEILAEYPGKVLVFSRTKFGAQKICSQLSRSSFGVSEIHSNRSQSQRKEAMEGFRRGRHRILVATDIAARGIDVRDIELVINFDLPDNSGDYVHRIGRTGRAGREGKAISFATPDQKRDIRDIERLIRNPLKVTSKLPASHPDAAYALKPLPKKSNTVRTFRSRRGPGRKRF